MGESDPFERTTLGNVARFFYMRTTPLSRFFKQFSGENNLARINLEDSIFKENDFTDLCIAAGSRRMALGALTELWIEAQKHYLEFGEIPNHHWVRVGLPEYLIATNWAERTATGVKVRGQEKQFAWLKQRSDAGKARTETKTKSLKQNAERSFDNLPNGSQRGRTATEPLPLSLTPPLTLSLAQSQNLGIVPEADADASCHGADPVQPSFLGDTTDQAKAVPSRKKSSKAVKTEKTLGSRIFEAYAEAFRVRHGEEPIRDRVANSLTKAIGESLGEEGIEVARFYVQHNKALYIQAYHPLTLFKQDANALRTQYRTGKVMTTGEARDIENRQNQVNVWGKHMNQPGVKK